MINKKDIRSYEVSIWTLQDSFITVLKTSDLEHKGQLQEPRMTLKNDGTQEFSFKIPMHIRINGELKENPLWYNTRNGILIADMRKIKVIFNKRTKDEAIFEFLITKVTETHEGFEKTCEVECEGLAFHELGKQGYKIELTQDIYELDDDAWLKGGQEGDRPVNNLNYWMDKVIEDSNWNYRVEMDWTGYTGNRDSGKIYEDEYVSSWNVNESTGELTPAVLESAREKYRLLDETNSNRYNLTQSIAEIFEVFCRYEYVYDEDYHIKERWIIFYNNFVQERGVADENGVRKGNIIDFTYYYDTEEISRECDSTDIVTKMYVNVLEDENMESGQSTIMDTDANRSREDYLLNFDYLYEIGTISTEQYKEIPKYEAKMRELNMQLFPIEDELIRLRAELPEQQANLTIAKNAADLDQEQISANNELKEMITNNTGVVSITNANPRLGYAINDYDAGDGTRCITVKEKGVIQATLQLYTKYTASTITLNNQLKNYKVHYDDNGNIDKIYGLPATFEKDTYDESSRVYMIYDYDPQLYYQNIIDTFTVRLGNDQAAYEKANNRVEYLEKRIAELEIKYNELIANKKAAIARFEKTMGPALREGNWTPEDDYANYGDKHTESLSFGQSAGLISLEWDAELFDDEDKLYFNSGIAMKKKYYPCVDLSDYFKSSSFSWEDLERASFIFKDVNYDITSDSDPITYLRYYAVGSKAQLRFVRNKNNNLYPVMVLYGADELSDELYNVFSRPLNSTTRKQYIPKIGIITTTLDDKNKPKTTVTDLITTENIKLLTLADNDSNYEYEIVYPRFKINSGNVKVTSTEPGILYNKVPLTNYEDYYILSRLNENESNYTYYATIKPEVLFEKKDYEGKYDINFTVSNTSLFIYLDAIQVLKENAYPKVSYEIKPSLVNSTFAHTAYNRLNQIAHINDPELKFENVMGYISEVELDLDKPWEDTVTIQNYKTKFEDLFSSIVASTEEMKKNSYIMGIAARAFTTSGELNTNILQGALNRVDLNYAFNNGTLTINEKDGIWGISDAGVVAFRGGGIFTSTQKDSNGNWIWNTGIVPSGINASLITTGQLDTNLIRIYSGDDLKFQMNGDGLYAYKSWLSDAKKVTGAAATIMQESFNNSAGGYDGKQYVVHNENGLFLIAEKDAIVPEYDLDDKKNIITPTNKYTKLNDTIERVAISWDGLKLKNWKNETTFFASPDTGDLFISGTLNVDALTVTDKSKWNLAQTGVPLSKYITDNFEDHVQTSDNLKAIFDEAGEILQAAGSTLNSLNTLSDENKTVLSDFLKQVNDLTPATFTSSTRPGKFKPGDIWEPEDGVYKGNKYIAMAFSDKSNDDTIKDNPLAGWNRTYDGSLGSITGAGIKIDAVAGTLDLYAGSKMTLKAKSQLDLASGDIQITGNHSVNIGSKWINIGSENGGINIISTDINKDTTTDGDGKVNTNNTISKVTLSRDGIVMRSNKIDLMAGNTDSVAALQLDPSKGIWIGSNKEIKLFSSNINSSANILIDPSKILFGVSATGSASAVELTKDYAIFAAANQREEVEKASASSWSENNSNISGAKITKDGIWLATGNGSTRSLISMQPGDLTIGVAASGDSDQGSFIHLSQSEMKIGALTNIYINAANIGLDTLKTQSSGGYEQVGFRLGTKNNPVLVFEGDNLHVKGAITATELKIGNNETNIETYLAENITIGGRNLLALSQSNSNLWSSDGWLEINFSTSSGRKSLSLWPKQGKEKIIDANGQYTLTIETKGFTIDDRHYIHLEYFDIAKANRSEEEAVSKYINITTNIKTFEVKDSIVAITFMVSSGYTAKGFIRLKLEKGNKSTDWTPAPEDTNAHITQLEYDMYTADGIVQGVISGNKGLVFSRTNEITEVSLNKNGLYIVGKNSKYQSLFRATSDAMGFFAYGMTINNKEYDINDPYPLLYYDQGSLYIRGNVYANAFFVVKDETKPEELTTFPSYIAGESVKSVTAQLQVASSNLYKAVKEASDKIISAHTFTIGETNKTLADLDQLLKDTVTAANKELTEQLSAAAAVLLNTIDTHKLKLTDALINNENIYYTKIGSVESSVKIANDYIDKLKNTLGETEDAIQAKYTTHVGQGSELPKSSTGKNPIYKVGDLFLVTPTKTDAGQLQYALSSISSSGTGESTKYTYTWTEMKPSNINLGTTGSINMAAGSEINMTVSDINDTSKSIFTMNNSGITIGSSGKLDLESGSAINLTGAEINLKAYKDKTTTKASNLTLEGAGIELISKSVINMTGGSFNFTSSTSSTIGNVFVMDDKGITIGSLRGLTLVSGTANEGNLFSMDSEGITIYTGTKKGGGIYLVTGKSSDETNSNLVSLDSNGITLHTNANITLSSSKKYNLGSAINISNEGIDILSDKHINIATTDGSGNAITMSSNGMYIGSDAGITVYSGAYINLLAGDTTSDASGVIIDKTKIAMIASSTSGGIFMAASGTKIYNSLIESNESLKDSRQQSLYDIYSPSDVISGSLLVVRPTDILIAGPKINIGATSSISITSGGSIALGTVKRDSAGKYQSVDGLYICNDNLTMTGGNVYIGGSNKIVIGNTSTGDTSQTVAQDSGIVVIDKYGVGIGSTGLRVITNNFKVIPGATGDDPLFYVGKEGSYIQYSETDGLKVVGSGTFSGTIKAINGDIGGWLIGDGYLSAGTAKLGEPGIYFGQDGFSFVDSDENTIFKLSKEDHEYKETNDDSSETKSKTGYVLEANFQMPSYVTDKTKMLAWTTESTFDDDNNIIPVFDNEPEIGTLGILYTKTVVTGTIGGAGSGVLDRNNWLSPGIYSTSGYTGSKFTRKYTCWNVSRGTADKAYADNWSRVGIYNDTDKNAATYTAIKMVDTAAKNSTVKVTFDWCVSPKNCTWESWKNTDTRINQNIPLEIIIWEYDVGSNTIGPEIGRTKVTLDKGLNISVNKYATYTYTEDITISKEMTSKSTYYITFWFGDTSRNWTKKTLIYIDPSSVIIGNGATSGAPVGLYIKTKNINGKTIWHQIGS